MDDAAAVAFLARAARPGGGWGYGLGRDALMEPTASVVCALAGTGRAPDEVARAVTWLLAAQHADGGWGIHGGDPESGWSTAWAVRALVAAGGPGDAVARGRAFLAGARPIPQDADDGTDAFWADNLRIDPRLQGWPWRPGEASWVEPTAQAMLSFEPGDPAVADRAREAVRYLEDRRCAGGGWNVGNPYMFGRPFHARAHTTALTVLALARWAPSSVRAEDLDTLRAGTRAEGGAGALAWGLIALAAVGADDADARARLRGLQAPDGGFEADPHVTALAVRALGGAP